MKQQSVSADGAEKVRNKTKSKKQHLPAEALKSAALEDEAKKMRHVSKNSKQNCLGAGEVAKKEHREADEDAGKKVKRRSRRRLLEAKQQCDAVDNSKGVVSSKSESREQRLPAETSQSAFLEDEAKELPMAGAREQTCFEAAEDAEKEHLRTDENAGKKVNRRGRLGGLFSTLPSVRLRRRVNGATSASSNQTSSNSSPKESNTLTDKKLSREATESDVSDWGPAVDKLKKQHQKNSMPDREGNCEQAAIAEFL